MRPSERKFETSSLRAARLTLIVAAGWIGGRAQTSPSPTSLVLDHVVAVVNNHAILLSDVNEEVQISILEPRSAERAPETPQSALQRLISRELIRQQMREEDADALEPTDAEVATRLSALRKELPACVRQNCATEGGWNQFLAAHGLTQEQVEDYLHNRMQILRFIEIRFRQGIHISDQEISDYYQKTLLPQYAKGTTIPPLNEVAPRIEEILLQQKVTALFGDWLASLRKQGDVEVLDPALESPQIQAQGGGAAQ